MHGDPWPNGPRPTRSGKRDPPCRARRFLSRDHPAPSTALFGHGQLFTDSRRAGDRCCPSRCRRNPSGPACWTAAASTASTASGRISSPVVVSIAITRPVRQRRYFSTVGAHFAVENRRARQGSPLSGMRPGRKFTEPLVGHGDTSAAPTEYMTKLPCDIDVTGSWEEAVDDGHVGDLGEVLGVVAATVGAVAACLHLRDSHIAHGSTHACAEPVGNLRSGKPAHFPEGFQVRGHEHAWTALADGPPGGLERARRRPNRVGDPVRPGLRWSAKLAGGASLRSPSGPWPARRASVSRAAREHRTGRRQSRGRWWFRRRRSRDCQRSNGPDS